MISDRRSQLVVELMKELNKMLEIVIRQVCGQTSGKVRVRTEIGQ